MSDGECDCGTAIYHLESSVERLQDHVREIAREVSDLRENLRTLSGVVANEQLRRRRLSSRVDISECSD